MRIVADFHIHSKYSRATSKEINISNLSQWAKWKGINLLGTGDFTHPLWFQELKNNLQPLGNGLYVNKNFPEIKFILTTELSSIYTQGGKGRRIHNVIFAPSFATVEKINTKLTGIGNLYSDGRPILGISARDLTKLILDIDQNCLIIPAHAWTPWFSVFGSASGFNSLEECFLDMTPNIFAIETGLSSDPEMNWRLSKLDSIALISCSDAHSLPNLGREATVFDIADNADLSYTLIAQMLKSAKSGNYKSAPSVLSYTIEFFPEEGKYHFDGHRVCNINLHPQESNKLNKICPVCQKTLTIGVMNRVEEYFQESLRIKNKFLNNRIIIGNLNKIITIINKCFQNGNKLIIAGNGGSASQAQHFAEKLLKEGEKANLSKISRTKTTSCPSL